MGHHPQLLKWLSTSIALLAMSGALWAATAFPSSVTVTVGGVAFKIPAPADHKETSAASPELWATAQQFGGPDARVLAHFVTTKDFDAFTKGRDASFSKYLYVQTPKRAESITATQAQFDKMRTGMVAMQTDMGAKLEPRLAAELAKLEKSTAGSSNALASLKIGEIAPVGVHSNRSDFLSYSVLAKVSADQAGVSTTRTMLATSGYWFVKGKVLTFAAYREFKSPKDLLDQKELVEQWQAAATAVN